jgi:photosystem II stability/assembly factor-like uncharacterized protein
MRRLAIPALALIAIAASYVERAPVVSAARATQPAASAGIDPSHYQDLRWRNVGPTRGGRVTAYAGVRTQPCTFYMGGTGGGVFKTENCGGDWTPISDGQMATGSIGSIDVSDSNPSIVWVGTGSAAIRSNVIIGRGAYKSTDAGRTWQFMGLKDAGQIGTVVIHPTNPDIVWLAALGSPFGPNAERGVFKTTDGGKTWKKTLFVNNETGARMVTVNFSNPNELYAGIYRGFRKGWDIISGGPATEGGIYKSTDGGETWTKLTQGLPGKLIGKIDVEIARSNPRVVYAMVEAPGDEGGLYKSSDSGATWALVNNQGNIRARPFYFHYVDVNPKNENDLWVGAVGQYRSTDGGKTFQGVSTPHADNHGIWFNPDNPDYAIQVNDGGANVTRDGGRTWSSILNQATAEIYMVSVDDQYPYMLYGPQQDNSTLVVPSQPNASFGFDSPSQAWSQASGCETGGIWPTPDGKVVWGACKGEVERFNAETGQSQGKWIYPQNRYGHHPADIKFRFPRQTVIMVSPHNPKVVYQASHVLHRSVDDGVNWEVISPDLTANEKEYQIVPGNPITRDVTGEEVYSSIYAMDESPKERGVIWVGANDGPVHVTRDNGRTWKNVTPKDLPPGGRVQNIGASPHRGGSAYIAVYRFLREHDLKPYIYRTDDYGATWTKITAGIPEEHPVRVVREDPERAGLLYAGTEFGFFVSFDNGSNWQPLQQNLPATPVTDIRIQRGDVVISTMGRSFWIMDNVAPLRALAAHAARSTGSTAPSAPSAPAPARPAAGVASSQRVPAAAPRIAAQTGPTARVPAGPRATVDNSPLDLSKPVLLQPASRVRYRSAGGGRGGAPQYPQVALAIDYILPAGFTGPLALEISDASGKVVRTVQASAGRGAPGGGGQRGGAATASGDPDDPDMRPAGRGRGGASAMTMRAGHNRFMWDYRWTNGPLVAPGRFNVSLIAGNPASSMPSPSTTKTFDVLIDPGVLKDGITPADLVEQQNFLLNLRDVQVQATQLRTRVQQAMQKAGVQPPSSPGAGESPFRRAAGTPELHPLQTLWARLVTAPGTYEQGMLIDQLGNISRAESGADQKVGAESRRRLDDLMKELKTIEAELAKIAQ